jgi:hypothetical protein
MLAVLLTLVYRHPGHSYPSTPRKQNEVLIRHAGHQSADGARNWFWRALATAGMVADSFVAATRFLPDSARQPGDLYLGEPNHNNVELLAERE